MIQVETDTEAARCQLEISDPAHRIAQPITPALALTRSPNSPTEDLQMCVQTMLYDGSSESSLTSREEISHAVRELNGRSEKFCRKVSTLGPLEKTDQERQLIEAEYLNIKYLAANIAISPSTDTEEVNGKSMLYETTLRNIGTARCTVLADEEFREFSADTIAKVQVEIATLAAYESVGTDTPRHSLAVISTSRRNLESIKFMISHSPRLREALHGLLATDIDNALTTSRKSAQDIHRHYREAERRHKSWLEVNRWRSYAQSVSDSHSAPNFEWNTMRRIYESKPKRKGRIGRNIVARAVALVQ